MILSCLQRLHVLSDVVLGLDSDCERTCSVAERTTGAKESGLQMLQRLRRSCWQLVVYTACLQGKVESSSLVGALCASGHATPMLGM
jgi:hypothetical protein